LLSAECIKNLCNCLEEGVLAIKNNMAAYVASTPNMGALSAEIHTNSLYYWKINIVSPSPGTNIYVTISPLNASDVPEKDIEFQSLYLGLKLFGQTVYPIHFDGNLTALTLN
jgi:hypothetical protein